MSVRISDAERTILDALDYPKTFSDLRAALQLVMPALDHVETSGDWSSPRSPGIASQYLPAARRAVRAARYVPAFVDAARSSHS